MRVILILQLLLGISAGAQEQIQKTISKKTAVFVVGNHGTEIIDLMAPFQVIAGSEAFHSIVVAPERKPAPLLSASLKNSGVDVVPDYSIQEYNLTPDLIVIPYIPHAYDGKDRPIVEWIKKTAGPKTVLLSICTGAEQLASTGLIDGLPATTNHRRIDELKKKFPKVKWVDDQRVVAEGNYFSSAALLSGIDASIAAVRKIAGPAAAEKAAAEIGYSYKNQPFERPKKPIALSVVRMLSPRDSLGVAIKDGVSELGLAAVLDFYYTSLSGKTTTLGNPNGTVKTLHGMKLRPQGDISAKSEYDRYVDDTNIITGKEPVRGALQWLEKLEGARLTQVLNSSFLYPQIEK